MEFLTAFDLSRVPEGFRGEEFEYLKLAFCGPACCGGLYKFELTAFFQPKGWLFGFSRLLVSGSFPLVPGLSIAEARGFKRRTNFQLGLEQALAGEEAPPRRYPDAICSRLSRSRIRA